MSITQITVQTTYIQLISQTANVIFHNAGIVKNTNFDIVTSAKALQTTTAASQNAFFCWRCSSSRSAISLYEQ